MNDMRIISGSQKLVAPGDEFTVEHVYQRNPRWRWWTFWLPKSLPVLQRFKVLEKAEADEMRACFRKMAEDGWL